MSDSFLFERVCGPAPQNSDVINIDCNEIEAISGMDIIPLSKSEKTKSKRKNKKQERKVPVFFFKKQYIIKVFIEFFEQ